MHVYRGKVKSTSSVEAAFDWMAAHPELVDRTRQRGGDGALPALPAAAAEGSGVGARVGVGHHHVVEDACPADRKLAVTVSFQVGGR